MMPEKCDHYQPLARVRPDCVWYDAELGYCTYPLLPWDSCLTGKQCLRPWEGKKHDIG